MLRLDRDVTEVLAREEEYLRNLQEGNTVIWLPEWGRRPSGRD